MFDPGIFTHLTDLIAQASDVLKGIPEDLKGQAYEQARTAFEQAREAIAELDLERQALAERAGLEGLADTPVFEEYAQPVYVELGPPPELQDGQQLAPAPETSREPQAEGLTDREGTVAGIVREETEKADARIADGEALARTQGENLAKTYADDARLPGMLEDLQKAVDANKADVLRQRDEVIQRRIEVEAPQIQTPPQQTPPAQQMPFQPPIR